MARILHITDPHIVVPPAKVSGRLDTARIFGTAMQRLHAHLSGMEPFDALLVSGDVSDDGSAESYALFRKLVAPLNLPLYLIPGNHDLRQPLRNAFADRGLPGAGRLNWFADIADARLIGLDTLREGQGSGVFDEETADFLAEALASRGKRPVWIAMHHPPFPSGIAFMDAIGLQGVSSLEKVLRGQGGDLRILCGHVHAAMFGEVAGVPALSAPSPVSSFRFDTRPDAPTGYFDAPGGFMVHDSLPAMRSIHIPAEYGAGPFAF